jgi:uncharacterized membrane protein YccC
MKPDPTIRKAAQRLVLCVVGVFVLFLIVLAQHEHWSDGGESAFFIFLFTPALLYTAWTAVVLVAKLLRAAASVGDNRGPRDGSA